MTDYPLEGTVHEFLDRLASSDPTPGGGSVAALTGALAAGLVSMVCQLTVGRQRYAEVQEEMERTLGQAEDLGRRFQELVTEDIAAYSALSAAYKLPRETEEEAQLRHDAIQQALVGATETPLQIAQAAREALTLAQVAAAKGNRLAVSDAGIAAVLAEAAAQAAAFNVWINLGASEDESFKVASGQILQEALEEAGVLKQQIVTLTQERMG